MEFWLLFLDKLAFATIPAVGFALLFNVPRHALRYCALLGALGFGSRYLIISLGVPIEWATFFAATIIGIIGVRLAHKFLAHPKVFTVAALIPMVPGVSVFKAMIALVEISTDGFSELLLGELIEHFLSSMFIISGLTIGLAMPGLFFYRRRSVV